MAKKLILGGLIGGAVLWIWGSVSWMLLPWHNMVMGGFTNEDAVVQAVSAGTHGRGVYLYPNHAAADADPKAFEEKLARGPFLFVAVDDRGFTGMAMPLIIAFLNQALGALLLTWIVLKTHGLSYGGKVGFVAVLALTAGVFCFFPAWNWFGFPTGYTLVMLADLVVGGILAGLVIGKVTA